MYGLFGRPVGSGMDFEGVTGNQGLLGGGFDPRTLGLLGAAASMLQASGPSKTPTSLGQVMGQGFQGGMGGILQAQQMEQAGQMNALRKAQMDEIARKTKAGEQQQAYLQQFGSSLPEADRPAFFANPNAYLEALYKEKLDTKPIVAPAGSAVIPRGATAPSFTVPFKPENTGPQSDLGKLAVDLKAGLITPAQFEEKYRKITTHQPPIATIDLRQDTKFNEKVGTELGEQYSTLLRADLNAPTNIGKYERLGQLLSNVNTGKFRGTITDMKAAAKAVGVDLTAMGVTDDVAPAQAARALSNQIALELRNPAGGAGMPGALSDKDREFLVQSIPGLENDPSAIGKMIEYRVKLEQRAQKVARMARDYRKKNGRFDEGFYDELQEWSNKNPLFSGAKQAPAGLTSEEQSELETLRKRFGR